MKRIFVLTLFLSFWSIITISANNAKTDSLYQCKEENDFTNGLDNRAPSFLINESFLDYEEEKSLYFYPATDVFVRDAEYFLPMTKGYTALGFHLNPSFAYKINDKSRVELGVHLTGIAGDKKGIRRVLPIVRIEYKPVKWLHIIGGTLYGNLSHQLYEPMYDFDRYFYSNQEMGLQILTNTRYWDGDIWCNWEQFIVPNDNFQEKFTFGWKNNLKLPLEKVELSIPIDLMANHRGGQFTALKDTCIETLINFATGFRSKFIGNNQIHFTAEIPLFFFKNQSNEEHIHTTFHKGWGLYPMFTIQNNPHKYTKNQWLVNLGFWYGDKYISGRGSYLFQSRSLFDISYQKPIRKMATAKANYCHQYKGLKLGVEFQAYYDIEENGIDYAAGIYLNFNRGFKVISIK
jgi:hypothetical protein